MLRELIAATIADQPDLEVVEPSGDGSALDTALERAGADVAIVGAERLDSAAVATVLRRRPCARVLRISADGRETSLWELRPHERRLGDVSPGRLLDAIRATPPI